MWKYNNTDELYHAGVLGMKWGHRTLTRSQTNKAGFKAAKKEFKLNDNKLNFNKAKAAYKAEKRAIRGDINDAAQRQRHSSSFGERLLYNDATRRRAGKLMVEKKMSEMDAVSKAKKEAWRNTGIAALGLMGIAYATRAK